MKNPDDGSPPRRKTGRPLSFDRDAALEQAMLTFWRHGYETTSIVDLTTAMGVTAPSLYSAFGDKKRLFLEAARLYAGDPEAMARDIQGAPSAYDAANAMLTNAAVIYTGDATPKGCLLASATASGSAAACEVQGAIADIRKSMASCLEARIRNDVATGKLSAATDAAALAGLVMAVAQGMSVLARDGASRSFLLAIVGATMAAWPQE
ncbi:TetR/AcrR family transcriptional regulator [Microvirga antarctica]|uniref:TetR/AcrR family transcriptional regulator n=1 Tax=Microvirga antarctica TaxID=2819233 RepID=UPI001B304DBB|nr:TetR/AcrR family transcriptional regulator [Microvirga antarctica]